MDIVANYKRVYGLERVEAEQVLAHKELEGRLTEQLLASTPETRWETFSRAYTELYQGLPWLNEVETKVNERHLANWGKLIPKRSAVFEVGSGKAVLLKRLVRLGHRCVATEITPERGSKHFNDDGLEWRQTDGVNLAKFEAPGSYDVVISTQVIEHFHPQDVGVHFENVREILDPGGRYIFDTPHRGTGPHDLSKVFEMDRAQYMHLKEYTFRELKQIAKAAGFRKVRAVFFLKGVVAESSAYLAFLCMVDWLDETFIKSVRARRKFRRWMTKLRVPSNIWMSATK